MAENEIKNQTEYIDNLLREIALRDRRIDEITESNRKLRSQANAFNETLSNSRNEVNSLKTTVNMLREQIKQDGTQKRIEDLEQRLHEMTIRAEIYSQGTGALMRDADTRRKELRLIKAKIETLIQSLDAFLDEERKISEIHRSAKQSKGDENG